ncbi:Clp protease N-terminal domain-containing protein [Catellatospora bangladeshensis]|uniref:Clp protease N-terminal domain-containing protein n=1 Tax=Catellatospora bangladeshensis TaxID=310355 RepID=UPI003612A1E0
MPKINVYLPDDLADAVREAGVPVSAVCQRALEQAVRRVTMIRATALSDLDGADLTTRLPHATGRTHTVLRLAAEQARDAGSAVVSTGHLLGAILAEGDNLALRVLGAMEIEPAEVARWLAAERDAEAGAGPDGTRRFSVPAAGVLELAATEATGFGHNYLGTEHLLLGLVAEPDGTGGRALRGAASSCARPAAPWRPRSPGSSTCAPRRRARRRPPTPRRWPRSSAASWRRWWRGWSGWRSGWPRVADRVLLLATKDTVAYRRRPGHESVATGAELLAAAGPVAAGVTAVDVISEPGWDLSPTTLLALARRVREAAASGSTAGSCSPRASTPWPRRRT